MRNLRSLKQKFLRKWMTGLRKYNTQKKNMNLLERKKAIKLSADLAMASTRDKTTLWSQALIINNNISCKMLTSPPRHCSNKVRENSNIVYRKRIRRSSNRRRSNHTVIHGEKERVAASVIAKILVQKRTRRLRSLIPGGELMDDVCLVEETLDYIQSLRAQVEVMRFLVTASQLIIN